MHDPHSSRFGTIPACAEQTHGHGRTYEDGKYRVGIVLRGKNRKSTLTAFISSVYAEPRRIRSTSERIHRPHAFGDGCRQVSIPCHVTSVTSSGARERRRAGGRAIKFYGVLMVAVGADEVGAPERGGRAGRAALFRVDPSWFTNSSDVRTYHHRPAHSLRTVSFAPGSLRPIQLPSSRSTVSHPIRAVERLQRRCCSLSCLAKRHFLQSWYIRW